jgi:hypothetical protein
VSDQQPTAWGGPPAPPRTPPPQPVGTRQCPHCGWPTPAAEPVCRHCGTDARVVAGARPGPRPFVPGPTQGTNGFAVASLVLGILWLYWLGSVLALVFGYIARRQIAERQGLQDGRGMATAGIVLGWIGVGFLALLLLLVVLGMATEPTYDAMRLLPS